MTRKTSAQLDREIASASAPPAATAPKRITAALHKKLRKTLFVVIKEALLDRKYNSKRMTTSDYDQAGDDAIRIAGLKGRAVCQGSDWGVDIWEVFPGGERSANPITGYFADDDEEDLMEGEDWP